MRPRSPTARMRGLLDVSEGAEGLRVTLERAFEAHVALRMRWSEVRRGALKLGARVPDVSSIDDLVVCLDLGPDGVTPTTLASMMAHIALRPLTGRMVIQALGISNRERIRWTKDGRLPAAGFTQIRRGHVMSIPTYDPVHIQGVHQAKIHSWREADARSSIS